MSPSSTNEARYSGNRDDGERHGNPDEHHAWAHAEAMMEQARAMMREAETAMETWKVGKEMNRVYCKHRGISETDAEIRWAATATAKNAISANNFYVTLAQMYYGAASASYSRALYLRSRDAARI
ncbi:hypothetical protein [Actinoplanes regularis]|uniref:Uncharacterized protein n=1 Tax=Actinoplanes regularis TaxID=52697 RepID=A0A238XF70_9ACTN|nr:hypothetical protein [Actinoplanes regularis]GIE86771.1 hypothetical protein Are01nite_32510 [Actinoplanes regularis]SNR57656.1 hypothetical protein SAMN06264365_103400 [Actinoplanes regularis]